MTNPFVADTSVFGAGAAAEKQVIAELVQTERAARDQGQWRRAVAETGCAILLPGVIGGVEVVVTCQARLHARATRIGGEWRLSGLTGAYHGDALATRDGRPAPALNQGRLAALRAPYRYMAYLLAESGKTAREDLAGPDRPELMAALWKAEADWLAKG